MDIKVIAIISSIMLVTLTVGLFWMQRQASQDYTYIAYVQALEVDFINKDDIDDELNISELNIQDDNSCPAYYKTYLIEEYTYIDDYTNYDTDYDYDYECYEAYIPFVPVFTSEPLPEHIIAFITGVTFREYTPFTHCFLTYLTITFVDFYGEDRIGHMIVAAEIGDEVLEIFQEIYESGFPIYSMQLIDYFDAIDYYSLTANNSSAFNFRYIANTSTLSRHAFGMAIDINPIQNPYVRGDNVLPAAGRPYLDRTYVRPGMITSGDVVYQAFTSRGWIWGGTWTSPRDYHHFERR